MFEAKLASAALLKKLVESIKDLVVDIPFDCTEQGICVQSMDSSHVALVALKLEPNMFEHYRCDRSINFGISLEQMVKALKCSGSGDICVLKHDESSGETLTFSFFDDKKEQVKDIVVKLMDLDVEHLGIPDQEYSVKCEMNASDFKKVCNDMALFGDSLRICATKVGTRLGILAFQGSLLFATNGESGSYTVSFATGTDDETVVMSVQEATEASFSIKYLVQLAKAASLSERVKLSFSKGTPIVLEFPIQGTSYLRFFLAPKLDEDDMDE